MGAKAHQMHTAVSRKAWNARRERCLNRLARDFGRMPLVKSACRVRGNISRVVERFDSGEKGMWPFIDQARGTGAFADQSLGRRTNDDLPDDDPDDDAL